MDTLRGELTASQLAAKHATHQTMEGLGSVFSGKAEAKQGMQEEDVETLHAKIGQL